MNPLFAAWIDRDHADILLMIDLQRLKRDKIVDLSEDARVQLLELKSA